MRDLNVEEGVAVIGCSILVIVVSVSLLVFVLFS